MKNSVAILTDFSTQFQAYSINIIVERQIKMLREADYKPKVIVMESFVPTGEYTKEGVALCKIPDTAASNDWGKGPEFDKDVEMIKGKLLEYLKEINVVITHDISYQVALQKYDAAARQVAKERPDIRWLHWVHSTTASQGNKEKFPNSLIVYPNSYDIPRVAETFKVEEDNIKVVPHPIDVCSFFGFHPLSEKLVNEKNILGADVVCVYPLRLDRGKQPECCIKVMKQLKKMEKSVRMVFMDFHSTGGDKVKYREELKQLAIDSGLASNEVVFTSEFDDRLKLECPRQMVKDLMCISNVFILPSKSETFSLVAQEAAITGNFLILNFDFPPIRSIYGDKPLYRKFSSCIDINTGLKGETNTKYTNEEDYFHEIAGCICSRLEHDPMMALRTKTRKEQNLKAVFRKYFEPLLYWGEK